jgi:hypothetical protein
VIWMTYRTCTRALLLLGLSEAGGVHPERAG